ncbi:winged helix-turn-helix domain-containing protein [Ornithinimicrobium pratense]|uniref:Helix-turn-helix transcriptional regulator n=1 Tax=Ornithinimicrobium pratense TaxID=2593973 RepID=A0A5J6V7X2_9MICO|nr:helix-turn-helix domain-containing protein [Ornithinimicrobium pratense]QFG69949.1 helix-turn-helix transcriptional regulator [Ornithinimicrobium pratense]
MFERNPPPVHARAIDTSALKAFAHPLRLRLYDHLKDHGPATATMLARATGESTGQTSYHLRQLERHGVVSELVGRGTGRERWWQAEGISFGFEVLAEDPGALTSVELIQRHQVQERARRGMEWIDRQPHEEREWLEVAITDELTARMTPQELQALNTALAEVVAEHRDRARAAREEHGDEGTRTVKVYRQLFPLRAED